MFTFWITELGSADIAQSRKLHVHVPEAVVPQGHTGLTCDISVKLSRGKCLKHYLMLILRLAAMLARVRSQFDDAPKMLARFHLYFGDAPKMFARFSRSFDF
eukprot:371337-Pyramimonas_sp.AAC.1